MCGQCIPLTTSIPFSVCDKRDLGWAWPPSTGRQPRQWRPLGAVGGCRGVYGGSVWVVRSSVWHRTCGDARTCCAAPCWSSWSTVVSHRVRLFLVCRVVARRLASILLPRCLEVERGRGVSFDDVCVWRWAPPSATVEPVWVVDVHIFRLSWKNLDIACQLA